MFLQELWRYPIKSLRGEPLQEAVIGRLGIEGDRQRAVVDPESDVSLSAKRHGELLLCRAWTVDDDVMVGLPDGSEFPADSPQAADGLSALLDREVEVRRAEIGKTVQHEYTTDSTTGEGDPMVVEAPLREAFFDGLPVHLLSDATLREFTRRQPGSKFGRARFRPNLLIHTDEEGFVEDGWVGSSVSVGAVSFSAEDFKTRCVMTTRPQGELLLDREVFKAVVRENQRRAGIELVPTNSATIHVGDPVTVSA
ncbi:MAG: MOSC N-terminal beta barrel domain-containing protein [Acidimicrobiia bacterium]|jgi:hypothetical protein